MAMVIPEVFADAVNSAMDVSLRIGRVATDYTDMVEEITTYGDTVHFPTIDRISDAETVTQGTAIVPDTVSMTDASADIKQVAKSVRVYDKDSAQVKGALKDKMAEQLGQSMAKAVDKDLASEIQTATYAENVLTSDFTVGAIEGAFGVFGDQVDSDSFAGIVLHSSLRPYITVMDAFVSANRTNTTAGNGIVKDGIIGYWNDIPCYLSDNGTSYTVTIDSSDKDAVLFAIVKKDALGYVYQKQATVEEEREAKLLATDLVASELYAVKLVNASGVSLLNVYTA